MKAFGLTLALIGCLVCGGHVQAQITPATGDQTSIMWTANTGGGQAETMNSPMPDLGAGAGGAVPDIGGSAPQTVGAGQPSTDQGSPNAPYLSLPGDLPGIPGFPSPSGAGGDILGPSLAIDPLFGSSGLGATSGLGTSSSSSSSSVNDLFGGTNEFNALVNSIMSQGKPAGASSGGNASDTLAGGISAMEFSNMLTTSGSTNATAGGQPPMSGGAMMDNTIPSGSPNFPFLNNGPVFPPGPSGSPMPGPGGAMSGPGGPITGSGDPMPGSGGPMTGPGTTAPGSGGPMPGSGTVPFSFDGSSILGGPGGASTAGGSNPFQNLLSMVPGQGASGPGAGMSTGGMGSSLLSGLTSRQSANPSPPRPARQPMMQSFINMAKQVALMEMMMQGEMGAFEYLNLPTHYAPMAYFVLDRLGKQASPRPQQPSAAANSAYNPFQVQTNPSGNNMFGQTGGASSTNSVFGSPSAGGSPAGNLMGALSTAMNSMQTGGSTPGGGAPGPADILTAGGSGATGLISSLLGSFPGLPPTLAGGGAGGTTDMSGTGSLPATGTTDPLAQITSLFQPNAAAGTGANPLASILSAGIGGAPTMG